MWAKPSSLLLILLFGFALPLTEAAILPGGFTETVVASGILNPTAMDFAPDGRLFVCEQGGRVRIIKNGVLLSTPFLSINVFLSEESGLLGIAFDPAFSSNRYVYLFYTATSPTIHNRVSRFIANGDVANAASETIILEIENLSGSAYHNGGAIHFGPDGKLYVAIGDNRVGANSQALTNISGKMLRINSDGSIPSSNPFYTAATGKNRAIWAMGLRNPFTFVFQPGTGKMFINDVGASRWEEINQGAAGANYGWPIAEGGVSCQSYQWPKLIVRMNLK